MMKKAHFLALHPLMGTKNNPSARHLMERSPYYWWWEFLRRNSDYLKCCEDGGVGELADLYADFGDVRTDDFRTWWGGSTQRGATLFAEQEKALSVKKIDAVEEISQSWGEDVMVVAVDMNEGRRYLQKKFAELLEKHHEGRRGRKSMRKVKSTARYPLHRNFSKHNLKRMIAVYDAVTQNAARPLAMQQPQWKLGEELKLVPVAMPHKHDNLYDIKDKRRTMQMTVSRYMKDARAIIANTGKGTFPNSDL